MSVCLGVGGAVCEDMTENQNQARATAQRRDCFLPPLWYCSGLVPESPPLPVVRQNIHTALTLSSIAVTCSQSPHIFRQSLFPRQTLRWT